MNRVHLPTFYSMIALYSSQTTRWMIFTRHSGNHSKFVRPQRSYTCVWYLSRYNSDFVKTRWKTRENGDSFSPLHRSLSVVAIRTRTRLGIFFRLTETMNFSFVRAVQTTRLSFFFLLLLFSSIMVNVSENLNIHFRPLAIASRRSWLWISHRGFSFIPNVSNGNQIFTVSADTTAGDAETETRVLRVPIVYS